MSNSEVYLTIIVVLGLISLGLLIAVIVVAASESSPIIYFSHFTAECVTMFQNGDGSGEVRLQRTKDVVFDDYTWIVDSYFEDEIRSRLFSTDDDDSTTTCERVGNHDNCYVVTAYDEYNFKVPSSAVLLSVETDCSDLAILTGRSFEKCDVYSYSEGLWVKKVTVESDTDYPVMVETTTAGSGSTVTETLYMSFDPSKPKDKSNLKPFDGVKVYDFRNGKGDAGNGKSNTYTKASATESLIAYLWSKISPEKKLLTKPGQEVENENDPLEKYFKSLENNKMLREMLHLPPMGLPSKYVSRSIRNVTRDDVRDIPASFDAREHWSNCKSVINTITNQGSCGSCWAMAGSSVLADRYCIATGARVRLSPQYLVYCATHSNGCSGTESEMAVWEDIKTIGIPTESCIPFKGTNGECPKRCEDGTLITESMKVHASGYNVPWAKTDAERVEAIQREIMTNGPVEAFYWVFTDFSKFFTSSKGIYHRSEDARYKGGGHAIRIIGWGREAGEDYWLIANSYGTDHPAGGFFRMRRGNNECNLEEQVAAGIFG